MDQIEHDIITRCLHMVYGQLLTEEVGVGLWSIERLIFLVRYMTGPGRPTTLQEELRAVQQTFQIYQVEGENQFQVEVRNVDLQTPVGRNTLLYEICQHGMELLHNGCRLQRIVLFQNGGHLAYTFTDIDGQTYGGTVYGEEPESGGAPV